MKDVLINENENKIDITIVKENNHSLEELEQLLTNKIYDVVNDNRMLDSYKEEINLLTHILSSRN